MSEAASKQYLIRKRGYFYRPDGCGYTSSVHDAGRYSLKEAIDITHPNGSDGSRDGMSYIEDPAPSAPSGDSVRERVAEIVYEAMTAALQFPPPPKGRAPAWQSGGNSDAQNEARRFADAALRAIATPEDGQ